MSNNGPFGALAEGLQAGFGIRQAYKQRKFDESEQTRRAALEEEMRRGMMDMNLKKLAIDKEMSDWQRTHGDAQLAGQRDDAAARQDAAFAGASPQAQQMMLAGNQPVGVGVFAPGAGPADVQRFQERMPLVQERLGQEQEDRARGIQMQEQAQRDTQARLAGQMLKNFGAGNRHPQMGWTQTTSTDEEGNPVVTRIPVMPGQQPPAPQAAAPVDPQQKIFQDQIDLHQQEIARQRIKKANGDNGAFWRYGPDTYISEAQSKIDALRAEAAKGQPTPGAALPLGVAPVGPTAPQAAPANQGMRQWALANPNDPRARAIIQRLGAQ